MYRPKWITQTVSADQLWFSNVNCPKISEQRWFISEQPWFNSKHSWTGKVSHLRTGAVSALTFSWSGLIESWTAWISYGTELNRSDLACQFEWLFSNFLELPLVWGTYFWFSAQLVKRWGQQNFSCSVFLRAKDITKSLNFGHFVADQVTNLIWFTVLKPFSAQLDEPSKLF